MSGRVISSLLRNANEEDLQALLQEVDVQAMLDRLGPHLANELEPHFEEIRTRAQNEESEQAREFYESLPEEEQQEAFEKAVAELATVLQECRENPVAGFPKLKALLRDPDIHEPLLLIFENPNYIDPEYTTDLKEFATYNVRWLAMQVLPELYTPDEVNELLAKFGRDEAEIPDNN